jgi:hypothetical protein
LERNTNDDTLYGEHDGYQIPKLSISKIKNKIDPNMDDESAQKIADSLYELSVIAYNNYNNTNL